MNNKTLLATVLLTGGFISTVDACQSLGDGQLTTFEVKASALNMRVGAGTNHRVITTLPKGTKVYCENKDASVLQNGFLKVTDGHYEGWMSLEYLELVEEDNHSEIDEFKPTPSNFVGVTTANLNLRYGKGTNHSIKFTMPKGTKVNVINESNGWLYVKVINPKTNRLEFGYCSAKYIR